MTNPFVIAMRQNPEKFLSELGTRELEAVGQGIVAQLAARAQDNDPDASAILQRLYRIMGEVEI